MLARAVLESGVSMPEILDQQYRLVQCLQYQTVKKPKSKKGV